MTSADPEWLRAAVRIAETDHRQLQQQRDDAMALEERARTNLAALLRQLAEVEAELVESASDEQVQRTRGVAEGIPALRAQITELTVRVQGADRMLREHAAQVDNLRAALSRLEAAGESP